MKFLDNLHRKASDNIKNTKEVNESLENTTSDYLLLSQLASEMQDDEVKSEAEKHKGTISSDLGKFQCQKEELNREKSQILQTVNEHISQETKNLKKAQKAEKVMDSSEGATAAKTIQEKIKELTSIKQELGDGTISNGPESDSAAITHNTEGLVASGTIDSDMADLMDYMNKNNLANVDYPDYVQDPEWKALHSKKYPEYKEIADAYTEPKEVALEALTKYMVEHNYGYGDYPEYSLDPEWQTLYERVYGNGMQNVKGYNEEDLNYAKEHYDELSYADSFDLTAEERSDFYDYTKGVSTLINESLRYGNDAVKNLSAVELNKLTQRINNLTDCLDRKTLSKTTRLYRGVEFATYIFGKDGMWLSIPELSEKYAGHELTFTSPEFSSCSVDYDVARNGFAHEAMLYITAPAGTKGMFLGEVSKFEDDEKECLLQRDTIFQIDKVYEKDGLIAVEVTVKGNIGGNDEH